MPRIELINISKRWGKFVGVDHLNMVIEDRDFITLLGPSGCGKTTTLRMIAGLETPTEGKIIIGDKVVFDSELGINLSPAKRDIGFLFQNYALWPHMTVYKNIAFGLENTKDYFPVFDKEGNQVFEPDAEKVKGLQAKADELKATIEGYAELVEKLKALKAEQTVNEEEVEATVVAIKEKEAGCPELEEVNKQIETEISNPTKPVMKLRHYTKSEIDTRVDEVCELLKIQEFKKRYPAELSGGQQQRVAIARTLAPRPSVLFMDEPLSNLDAKLRGEMRTELKRLHSSTNSTFVYVTHDQLEAMTLATRICLINKGVMQQYEPPLTVYAKPANLFVADFIGNPTMNFIEAEIEEIKGNKVALTFQGVKAEFTAKEDIVLSECECKECHCEEEKKAEGEEHECCCCHDEAPAKRKVVMGVRPEFLPISEKGAITGKVYGTLPAGMETTVKIELGDIVLASVVFGQIDYEMDSEVKFDISGDGILLYDAETQELVGSGSVKVK